MRSNQSRRSSRRSPDTVRQLAGVGNQGRCPHGEEDCVNAPGGGELPCLDCLAGGEGS